MKRTDDLLIYLIVGSIVYLLYPLTPPRQRPVKVLLVRPTVPLSANDVPCFAVRMVGLAYLWCLVASLFASISDIVVNKLLLA